MAYKSCTSMPDMFDSFLAAAPRNETLRELRTLLDWGALREVVAPTYKASGRVGFDPVVLIKLLLLERLYALSDVQVVEEAADRLSFREFLELGAGDPLPDDTTLVKFRGRLRNHDLFDALMAAIDDQLDAQGVGVEPGSIKIIDATLIRAAVRPPSRPKPGEEAKPALDPDADFTIKRGQAVYGYKLHMAQDRSTGLITAHEVTTASTHDSQVFEQLLTADEAEIMADKAYDSQAHRRIARAIGAKYSIMKRGRRGEPLSRWHTGRNRNIGRVRGFIEGSFAQLKRYLGCGRAIYRGLRRVSEQLSWGVAAFNLRRAVALRRAGVT